MWSYTWYLLDRLLLQSLLPSQLFAFAHCTTVIGSAAHRICMNCVDGPFWLQNGEFRQKVRSLHGQEFQTKDRYPEKTQCSTLFWSRQYRVCACVSAVVLCATGCQPEKVKLLNFRTDLCLTINLLDNRNLDIELCSVCLRIQKADLSSEPEACTDRD